jgi:hypothetical protein
MSKQYDLLYHHALYYYGNYYWIPMENVDI